MGDLVMEEQIPRPPLRARDDNPHPVLVSALPTALASAGVGAPLLSLAGFPLLSFAIWQFFSLVCHQDPARSFWIAGMPVAVCARCLGIYLGAAAGAWVEASRKTLLRALAIVLAASLLDFAAEMAGVHGNWPLARFALGAMLGGTMGALVANSLRREGAGRASLATD